MVLCEAGRPFRHGRVTAQARGVRLGAARPKDQRRAAAHPYRLGLRFRVIHNESAQT